MMGYSHAVTGMAGWLAVASTSGAALSIYSPGPGGVVLAGAVLCAGAAMAPDADHEQASIAHSLPPITKLMARGIGALSGGHRHGTHSLIGVAAFTLFAFLMSFWIMEIEGRTMAIGSGIIAVFLTAFATKSLGLHRSIGRGMLGDILGTKAGPWIVALGTAGVATYYMDYRWSWLPFCMALGCFIHVLGDGLTVQGVPWLWPLNPKPPVAVQNSPFLKQLWLKNGYFRLPVLGRTGGSGGGSENARRGKTSWQETLFITFVTIYVLYLVSYEILALAGLGSVLI